MSAVIRPTKTPNEGTGFFEEYASRVADVVLRQDLAPVYKMALALRQAWQDGRRVYICGNGGSAANAHHMANDLLYGVARDSGRGIRVLALTDNSSILTCLGNDIAYDSIFSNQLVALAEPGDVLIVMSGSGNSPNIVKALETAKGMGIKTFAILGYSGGKCLALADCAVHFAIDDMQVAEDMQLVVIHMVSRWLAAHPAR